MDPNTIPFHAMPVSKVQCGQYLTLPCDVHFTRTGIERNYVKSSSVPARTHGVPGAMSKVRFGHPLHASDVSAWRTLFGGVRGVQRP